MNHRWNYSKSNEHMVYVYDLYIELGHYSLMLLWKPVHWRKKRYVYFALYNRKTYKQYFKTKFK